MSFRIKRRRFGQLVIGSAVATSITNLTGSKTFAQNSQIPIGARKQNNTVPTDLANTTPAITLVSLDLTTGNENSTTDIPSTSVDNKDSKTEANSKAIYHQPNERITGLTSLSDGTLVLASVGQDQKGNYSKLLLTDPKSPGKTKSKKITGFKKNNNTIEGVLATQDDTIIAIVSETGGTPPFYLVLIDPTNGKLSSGSKLALPDLQPDIRFSNPALAPDGTIYATVLEREGSTTLVQLDPQKKSILTGQLSINKLAKLNYQNEFVPNDLLSLTFSPSGQLVALAKLKKDSTNSVLSVNPKTGEMTFLSKASVDKVTFPRK
jgi:hypothetical protein